MKRFAVTCFICSGLLYFSYAQEKSDPQAVKNLIGKNAKSGIDPYTGLNSIFTLKLKGISDVNTFDRNVVTQNSKKILTCKTNLQDSTTIITTAGNMEITDLKQYIYSQGDIQILDYRQDYYIKKN